MEKVTLNIKKDNRVFSGPQVIDDVNIIQMKIPPS